MAKSKMLETFLYLVNDEEQEIEFKVECTTSGKAFPGSYWDPPESVDLDDITLTAPTGEKYDTQEVKALFGATDKDIEEMEQRLYDALYDQDDFGDEDAHKYDDFDPEPVYEGDF